MRLSAFLFFSSLHRSLFKAKKAYTRKRRKRRRRGKRKDECSKFMISLLLGWIYSTLFLKSLETSVCVCIVLFECYLLGWM
ncbi:hypothetical protein CSUI_011126 [Cystoisospora suis]|uniref:Uncharacterized protein n=1 Tax=Cystoisospora suis TaxID=483139 RepID=A0A2C6JU44_9APIC|nr:hypothetical protein CSUI_011126 [Cystoisospora suis]